MKQLLDLKVTVYFKYILMFMAGMVLIQLLVKLYKLYYGNVNMIIETPICGEKEISIPEKEFTISKEYEGLGFSMSIWLYLEDYGYKYKREKVILDKGGFRLYFAKDENELVVEIPVFGRSEPNTIKFKKFPLQKWVNVIVILENRHLDLFINGKLYFSKYLFNLPLIIEKKDLILNPDGGFRGKISKLYHWSYPIGKSMILYTFNSGPVRVNILLRLYGLLGKIQNFFGSMKFSVKISTNNES
jgi:hypothetical protein